MRRSAAEWNKVRRSRSCHVLPSQGRRPLDGRASTYAEAIRLESFILSALSPGLSIERTSSRSLCRLGTAAHVGRSAAMDITDVLSSVDFRTRCAGSAPALSPELQRRFRHRSGWAPHRGGLPRTRGLTPAAARFVNLADDVSVGEFLDLFSGVTFPRARLLSQRALTSA